MVSDKIIDYRDLIQRCTTGFVGRQWVRDAVDEFLNANGPRSFLILGEPGSGKTSFLASLVHDRGYYHHFIGKGSLAGLADSADWRNPIRFAESIGYQLVRDYGPSVMAWEDWGIKVDQRVHEIEGLLTGAKVENFRAGPRPADRPILTVEQEADRFGPAATMIGVYIKNYNLDPDQVVRQLLITPLQHICDHYPERQLVLAVDGLDEADQPANARANLLHLLPGSESPANVRLILSSRPGAYLTNEFKAGCRVFYLSEDEQGKLDDHATADARAYVLQQVQSEPLQGMLNGKQIDAEDLARRVADASRGNFLYLHYYTEGLRDRDIALLDLTGLPQGLHGIYADFLAKIHQDVTAEYWDRAYKPLLGILSVVRAPLTRKQLAAFSKVEENTVGTLLTSSPLKAFVKGAGPVSTRAYAFYHKSFGDFLTSPENEDYVDPAAWHEKIIHACTVPVGGVLRWRDSEDNTDPYVMRYLVQHIQARLALAGTDDERNRWARAMCSVVLDERFRAAQQETLRDLYTTLTDLRAALAIALERDDLVNALACAGVYRSVKHSLTLTSSIFDDVQAGKFEQALERSKHYEVVPGVRGNWERTLQLYLAWQAAEAGNVGAVHSILESARPSTSQLVNSMEQLWDALLVRCVRALEQKAGVGKTAGEWLTELAPGTSATLLTSYDVAARPDPARQAELEEKLRTQLNRFTSLVDEGNPEAVSDALDPEAVGMEAADLRRLLVALAATDKGQAGIVTALKLILPNPYPRYRDIGLVAFGIACLAVPDAAWVRPKMQAILEVTLNREGVGFAFDLLATLLAEAENRNLLGQEYSDHLAGALQDLSDHLASAVQANDRWGTAMRAHSARAAGLFWQDKTAEAFAELQDAGCQNTGYAGYGVLTLLSLADRCYEFGDPVRAFSVSWGTNHDVSLLYGAMNLVAQVRDPQFRDERQWLVNEFNAWWTAPTPDLPTARAYLSRVMDPDTRLLYLEHVSARWTRSESPNRDGIKALVPIALSRGTALDTVLARLFGLSLNHLDHDALAKSVELCADYLLTSPDLEVLARALALL